MANALPTVVIEAFPPSATQLLDLIRQHVDDAMLMDIARADYGLGAAEIFASLVPIRDTGKLPQSPPGMLAEVMALTRNCQPDEPEQPPFEPGPSGLRGHFTRQFACAVLLLASADRASDLAEDFTLAQALASAKLLGDELHIALGSFLTWKLTESTDTQDALFFALGLLIVGLRFRSRISEAAIGELADLVIAFDTENHAWHPTNHDEPEPQPVSIQFGLWKPLREELLAESAKLSDGEVGSRVELCALLL